MSAGGRDAPGWRGTLTLPDRTSVRGRGVRHRLPAGLDPEFGLYLGIDYHPPWPHERVVWPNYGLPVDAPHTARMIEEAHRRARDGQRVEVACLAGRGRTGTVLACLAILAGIRAEHAVRWVRAHYDHRAVGPRGSEGGSGPIRSSAPDDQVDPRAAAVRRTACWAVHRDRSAPAAPSLRRPAQPFPRRAWRPCARVGAVVTLRPVAGRGKAAEKQVLALARVIAMVNDKGGVGKTSLVANLAGQLAAAGYRCLLVDLNRQANLGDDLGFRDDARDDQGAGLLVSIVAGTPVVPVPDVRPGLDVVPGGARLSDLVPLMVSRLQDRGREAFRALGEVLAPVAGPYDVVFVDCPPESTILTDLALTAARWVVMPTKSDAGGLVGMRLVGERFALARELNPDLRLLGAVLFATGTRSRLVHAQVRAAVEKAFGGHSPMFSTSIRHAERTAQDARRLGKLAHELELEVAAQPAWWTALRNGTPAAPRLSPTAASVAGDYRDLGVELLTLLRAAEDATSPAPGTEVEATS